MALTADQRAIINATVPVLAEHGLTVTQNFYKTILDENPTLNNLFSQSAQATGRQAAALATAVHAYAANIDDLTPILPVVERINYKHASLDIQPAQYAVVGTYLLRALRETLGAEVFTDEVRDAWAAAYNQLAEIMITREESIMAKQEKMAGGWRGWRAMKVVKKIPESSHVTSFYFSPADEAKLPTFKPGQYISIRVNITSLGIKQIRQYSLSKAPTEADNTFRISVKREEGAISACPGNVSNALHNEVNEGDIVELSHPTGDFFLETEKPSCPVMGSKVNSSTPVVLISAGVGITPLMSMLQHLTQSPSQRPISWIHVARNQAVDPFTSDIKRITSEHKNVKAKVFHSSPAAEEQEGQDFDVQGRLDLDQTDKLLHLDESTHYFVCGPEAFMAEAANYLKKHGTESTRIHFEVFGAGSYGIA